MASSLGCQVGSLPMLYLGIRVGCQTRRIIDWMEVVEMVKSRLVSWKSKKVSLGGRITLLKSVLAAIPIYRLSAMPMPVGTASVIRALQRNFLWGGDIGDGGKVSWIKWENLCKSKIDGGLGFKDLKWFNRALLGKWVWWFLNEKNCLWARVVASRHGCIRVDRSGLRTEGRRGGKAGWWSRIVESVKGEEGRWFWGRLKNEIGNGRNSSLWEDSWLGDAPHKVSFPRLYNLCVDKNATIADAGRWEEERWVWEIGWRRNLLDREKNMEARLLDLLRSAVIREREEDVWRWEGAASGKHSVKHAYADLSKAQSLTVESLRPSSGFKFI